MSRLCLLALAFGVSVAVAGNAQTQASAGTQETATTDNAQSPLCNPDSIDGTFTFASLPVGDQTVSLHFRNTSNTACRLQGRAGASFAVDGHGMKVENCWLCKEDGTASPAPEREPGDQILLAPGEWGTLDLHWASAGQTCQWADWGSFGVRWANPTGYLFIPSDWPMHICSAVKSSGYRAGAASPSTGASKDGPLRVSVLQKAIYDDERVTLHVELMGQRPSTEQSFGCAQLYTVRQAPSIGTRLDPLAALGAHSIASFTPEQTQEDQERTWPSWKKDRLRRCDIGTGQTTADAEISAADLASVTHIEWRAATPPGNRPAFFIASTHFTVLDPDTLPPNWGETVKGVHAGLSVDRTNFTAGERVPLHIRWENVNASMPLGQGECRDPLPALEIQDSQHHVLQTIPMYSMCMGHGWGPFTLPKGKAQRFFRELTTVSPPMPTGITPGRADLPGLGVYYLVSIWSPRVLELPPDTAAPGIVPLKSSSAHIGGVYAIARSQPVRIEVVASRNP